MIGKHNIHSINLTMRNERIYQKHFKTKGRNGSFSKWINAMMYQEFTLDEVEALNKIIEETAMTLKKLCKKRENILEKRKEPLIEVIKK